MFFFIEVDKVEFEGFDLYLKMRKWPPSVRSSFKNEKEERGFLPDFPWAHKSKSQARNPIYAEVKESFQPSSFGFVSLYSEGTSV